VQTGGDIPCPNKMAPSWLKRVKREILNQNEEDRKKEKKN
jgi:hypothetical protein